MQNDDIEHNEYVGQVSVFMRVLTCKNGNSIPHFEKLLNLKLK